MSQTPDLLLRIPFGTGRLEITDHTRRTLYADPDTSPRDLRVHFLTPAGSERVQNLESLPEVARRNGIVLSEAVGRAPESFAELTALLHNLGTVIRPSERFAYLRDAGVDLETEKPRIEEGKLAFLTGSYKLTSPFPELQRVWVDLGTLAVETAKYSLT